MSLVCLSDAPKHNFCPATCVLFPGKPISPNMLTLQQPSSMLLQCHQGNCCRVTQAALHRASKNSFSCETLYLKSAWNALLFLSRLTPHSLCWPWPQRPTCLCLCLWNAGMKGIHYHTWLLFMTVLHCVMEKAWTWNLPACLSSARIVGIGLSFLFESQRAFL